ncbi:MAG: hypothetical protein COV96_02325 [Candidatus Zambryskibacteria bacterium CG11_big_fil_rev_8_21_14_0_20_42_18]|uniref:Uncharacterized protein n=1 Tax=Candidatus Zambryskibacteria bacterium CG_4_9_14_3_um_filter_42_15 TaxID=1975112 RepID=A0A2M7WST5_9BACT|nr:MAG: hypothetical protein COV96_02325 [Candidatus Zambryskibacteria bacterium CG11_big_fil_rev_8_21_14_0_20_42_18]PJA33044.1 MAG: hypothetical protein CO185_00715 [Candidatus Zambryskibacteria bacterium CG_4_9_14_3_um_filter_42_15]
MRIPYFIQGALFGPALIGLTLMLKVICPASADAGCFADNLAVPIFLPLIFVYNVVDENLVMIHELWFLLLYWSFVGLLIGFIFDLRNRRSLY